MGGTYDLSLGGQSRKHANGSKLRCGTFLFLDEMQYLCCTDMWHDELDVGPTCRRQSPLSIRLMSRVQLAPGVSSMFNDELRDTFAERFGERSLSQTVPHWQLGAALEIVLAQWYFMMTDLIMEFPHLVNEMFTSKI